ncbi:uncharacterized protein LOC131661226 isoform X2 [Vicia villosa]|uniref:uncharacterized protein LOC131661226 isoform X2 n=1 Tax=Vicia villosa TaxID=3911 RepID=UPI00273CEE30|nr:uncharacterized protein LOC131661226 isoform X2 [Vicia villosa]
MKGFGSYNDWSYYASPSSNLSAFATPFSVNRSSPNGVSPPFIDPGDAVRPGGFPYRYPDQYEPQQYFNSYGVHQDRNSVSVVPDHWSSFSGFTATDGVSQADYVNKPIELGFGGQTVANQFADFGNGKGNQIGVGADKPNELGLGFAGQTVANQFLDFGNGKGNQIGVRGGFGLNQTSFTDSVADERMKSGCPDVTVSHVEGPHMVGWEKHSLTTSADPVDDKPFWWRTTKLANAGCQDITDSHGEVPHMIGWEKHSLPTSGDCVDDKSCWWRPTKPMPVDFSHTSVLQSPPLSLETHHEPPLKLAVDSGDHHFSYTGVYDKHLGQQDKQTRVDTVSTTITGSGTDLNLGIFVPDGGSGHKKFYDIKEAAACFGLNLSMNLDSNEASSSNNAMVSDMNDSGDVVDYKDKARHEFQYLQPNPGLLSLGLNAIQGVNSVDKSFECVGDPCNPSVDSPCWKGAPAAHFSYYESSEALPPENVPKNECFASVTREPQSFLLDGKNNVKKPCDSSFQMHIQIADQETYSAGSSSKQNSETRFASDDCNVVNAGPFHSEPSCDYELQYEDVITKMKDNSVPPTKPIDRESGPSYDEDQVTEENKLASQKLHTLCIGDADAGCNENICSASGTSLTVGHALSLSSLVEDASTTSEKSAGKVSTEELNAQMLVDTMSKFSQLLLNHCLNDACELEEQNCNILRDVITNLNTCVLKKSERINLAQECLLRQPETSRCAVESCEPQQGVQLTKIGPESSMDEPESQLAQKADFCFGSEKPYWMPSGFISPSSGAEMTKEENMTKAIKNILSENFDDDEATESQTRLYKNLWLEAEAALCSVTYKNRYNQLKIEMEKQAYKQRDMEQHSKSEVIPKLSRGKSSAIEVNKCLNSDSSAQNLVDLAATIPKELPQSKTSSDMNRLNSLTPEADGGQNLYNFIQNYAVSGTNKEVAGNDEASVMARYNVIKSRADNANDLETSSYIADMLAPQEEDNQNQVNFFPDSPIPGQNMADYETSVLTRFHFLKSRAAEDSSSVSSTEKLVEFSGEGIKETVITKDALEGESLNTNLNFYTAVEETTPKEIHLDWGERTYEFQPPNYNLDGLTSDWEHV